MADTKFKRMAEAYRKYSNEPMGTPAPPQMPPTTQPIPGAPETGGEMEARQQRFKDAMNKVQGGPSMEDIQKQQQQTLQDEQNTNFTEEDPQKFQKLKQLLGQ